ncbi:dynamin family protein [Phocaeicola barnesiae]|uniref:Dynamin family protein n=1 Tax=Phocaeicola barnesiae TaxID=376804 RepID=A0AAW5N582_9BACT|nr:dynamin family protein [Phocaeicola barnesiae]MCR8873868.1 dynamin family protein [Phocaeicola barnesiae]
MKQNQFLYYRRAVIKILEEYHAVRRKNNVKDKGLSASIERKAAPFVNGYFTLAIVGKMSAGKSTFINAFLGNKNILPTGHFQTTCVLTKIEYSEKESIEIIYGDGHKETINGDISGKLGKLVAIEDQYSSLPVNDINKLIIKGWNKSKICDPKIVKGLEATSCREINRQLLEQYIDSHPKSKIAKEVTIKYPLQEECEGWRIVDTPGVEAVGGIDMETMEFLTAQNEYGSNNVDAIIFLHKGTDNIEDKSINDFVKDVFKSLSEDAKKRIFFVVTNAADDTFQNIEEEYMRKAKALFVEPYGIKEERLIPVDSLMEILYHYAVEEGKDAVSLMKSQNAPDSSWNEKVWKICRSLLRDIRDTLEDANKNINNENLLAMVRDWSNFDKLRETLNEFVKSEKTNAYNDLIQTIREDIRQCIDHRKNDITLLQKGLEAMQGQEKALGDAMLEMNNTLNTIRRKFSKETVAERFNFIEQRINSQILANDTTYKDIQRETINLYDLADEKKNTLFAQMALEFYKFVHVGTSKAFFKRPDFEAIEKQATEAATGTRTETLTRAIPGICCDDHEEYTVNVPNIDNNKKLQAFKTMSVRHIRQEYSKFKNDIQEEVEFYISKVGESLVSSIETQEKHLTELKNTYKVSSPEQLQEVIKNTNYEIAVFEQFIKSLEKC